MTHHRHSPTLGTMHRALPAMVTQIHRKPRTGVQIAQSLPSIHARSVSAQSIGVTSTPASYTGHDSQRPETHRSNPPHSWPHAPQFCQLVRGSTSQPLPLFRSQSRNGDRQAPTRQFPKEHEGSPWATSHAVPHPPQCNVLSCVFTHAPLQQVNVQQAPPQMVPASQRGTSGTTPPVSGRAVSSETSIAEESGPVSVITSVTTSSPRLSSARTSTASSPASLVTSPAASGVEHTQIGISPTQRHVPRLAPHAQPDPSIAAHVPGSGGTSSGGDPLLAAVHATRSRAKGMARNMGGGYGLRERGVTARLTGTARGPAAIARNTPDGTRCEPSLDPGPIQLPTRPKEAPAPRASATGRAGSKPCRKSSSTVTVHRPSIPALLFVCSGNP